MAGLDLTPRLTRAWLEAQHLMNSYIETEGLDHLIYQLERRYRMLIVVECDTGLIETVAHVTNVLRGAQDSSVTCRGTEPLSRPNLITNGKRGRPYYEVHKEQIEYVSEVVVGGGEHLISEVGGGGRELYVSEVVAGGGEHLISEVGGGGGGELHVSEVVGGGGHLILEVGGGGGGELYVSEVVVRGEHLILEVGEGGGEFLVSEVVVGGGEHLISEVEGGGRELYVSEVVVGGGEDHISEVGGGEHLISEVGGAGEHLISEVEEGGGESSMPQK